MTNNLVSLRKLPDQFPKFNESIRVTLQPDVKKLSHGQKKKKTQMTLIAQVGKHLSKAAAK